MFKTWVSYADGSVSHEKNLNDLMLIKGKAILLFRQIAVARALVRVAG